MLQKINKNKTFRKHSRIEWKIIQVCDAKKLRRFFSIIYYCKQKCAIPLLLNEAIRLNKHCSFASIVCTSLRLRVQSCAVKSTCFSILCVIPNHFPRFGITQTCMLILMFIVEYCVFVSVCMCSCMCVCMHVCVGGCITLFKYIWERVYTAFG